ncbi:hypothetical protein M8J76_012760 [Diaphorina citri]|nr:hypothetical protein M8J76_012760 [Diaphorina citri]KAI5747966.1 hypothetical protein M8J77_020451 [Diaphorina citri]
MAGKGKKKNSIKTSENGEKKKGKKQAQKAVRKTGESKGKTRSNVDIFNEHAMENAYFTCHNVQDLLKCRGFPWPDLQKKKKKGKKGK